MTRSEHRACESCGVCLACSLDGHDAACPTLTDNLSPRSETFEREAYLSLADEFDAMGATSAPQLDDFDPTYVAAARRFATQRRIPLPWALRSLDMALIYVKRTDTEKEHEWTSR